MTELGHLIFSQQTRVYSTGFSGPQALRLELNYTISFSGSPVCRWLSETSQPPKPHKPTPYNVSFLYMYISVYIYILLALFLWRILTNTARTLTCLLKLSLSTQEQAGYQYSEVAQLCPTLCDPVDCSLPGSSVHGILQARVLEWGAIAFYMNCQKFKNT